MFYVLCYSISSCKPKSSSCGTCFQLQPSFHRWWCGDTWVCGAGVKLEWKGMQFACLAAEDVCVLLASLWFLCVSDFPLLLTFSLSTFWVSSQLLQLTISSRWLLLMLSSFCLVCAHYSLRYYVEECHEQTCLILCSLQIVCWLVCSLSSFHIP